MLTHRLTGTWSSSSGCGSVSSSLECVRLKHTAGDPVKTGVCGDRRCVRSRRRLDLLIVEATD